MIAHAYRHTGNLCRLPLNRVKNFLECNNIQSYHHDKKLSFHKSALDRVSKSETGKPVVIMLPWLGSSDKAIQKYSKIYENVGCDVIVKKAAVIDFLWPKTGLKNCRKFLLDVKDKMPEKNSPIVIHSFSIGCYFYSLMLIELQNEPETFESVAQNIKAQVFDSPVVGTLHEMATGIAVVMSKNAQSFIKNSILGYFALTKPYTVKIYDQAIDMAKFKLPCVPLLSFSAAHDPMVLPEAREAFVKSWKECGIDVTHVVWEDSKHAQNLKYHPEEYKKMIYNLLHRTVGGHITSQQN